MATAQAKYEFTDAELDSLVEERLNARKTELLEEAVGALEKKQRREKIRKAGGALDDDVGTYIWEGPDTRSNNAPKCSEFCCTPRPEQPFGSHVLKHGRGTEVHEGDRPLKGPQWRKATLEEAASIVTTDAGLRVLELRLRIAQAQEAKAGFIREQARTEELISELQKRLGELRDEAEKADARILEARKPLDNFLGGWPVERQRAAIALSEALEFERAQGRAGGGVPEPRSLGEHELSGDFKPPETVSREPEPARAAFLPGTNVVATARADRVEVLK